MRHGVSLHSSTRCMLLCALLLLTAVLYAQDATTSKAVQRQFKERWHVESTLNVSTKDAAHLNSLTLVLPIPTDNHYQTITNLQLPDGVEVRTDGTPYVCQTITEGFDGHTLTVSFDVELYSLRTEMFDVENHDYDTDSEVYRNNIGALGEFVVPEHQYIQTLGNYIWNKSTDRLDYLRNCSMYVAHACTYRLQNRGFLTMDEIVKTKTGECGDFTSFFVALARYMGIPARHVMAIDLNQGYHVWPEFYMEKCGWIPLDPTYDNAAKVDKWFGRHDARQVVMSFGMMHPITLDGDTTAHTVPALQSYHYWYRGDAAPTIKHTVKAKKLKRQ